MSIDTTKASILSVANKLFSRFGFQKTSMDEIAKIARKAKGSLYYHFPNKEELFKEVIAQEFENVKNQLSIIVCDNLNPHEKLKKYLLKRMEIMLEAKNYHETLQTGLYDNFVFLDQLRTELANWEKANIKRIAQEGIEQNIFEQTLNLDVTLDVFMLVLRGLEIPFFVQGQYKKYSPHFDELIGILLKGIKKEVV